MAMSVKTTLSGLELDSNPSHRTRIRSIRQKLLVWRAVSIGISSIALIVIIGQLYTVCKEVKFLQNVQNEWLPKLNVSTATSSALVSSSGASATSSSSTSLLNSQQQLRIIQSRSIENLRKDIEILIIELWSTRTTLILGVVFVLAYIFSWVWMTYQLELTLCVSLKSVLLLVVFAAVDIAASTGFILVRIIMSVISNNEFPRDMRIPVVNGEHEQFASIASLRLAVLQTSAGGSEIFISGLVAILTGIRVYIVANAVKFYNQMRKDSSSPGSSGSTALSGHHHHHHVHGPFHTATGHGSSSPQPSAHSTLHHTHHGHHSNGIHNNSGGDVSDSSGDAGDANVLLVGVSKSNRLLNGGSSSGSHLGLTQGQGHHNSNHPHHQQRNPSTPSPPTHHRHGSHLHLPTVDRRSPYTPTSHFLLNGTRATTGGGGGDRSPIGNGSSGASHILGLGHPVTSVKEPPYSRNGTSLSRKYSVATESLTGDDENETERINSDEFKIQAADMPLHMQRAALNGAINACKLYKTEKSIAESIKSDFDSMYGPTWHCIVGRNWGSCVTHSKQCYIRILYKDLTILLYKST